MTMKYRIDRFAWTGVAMTMMSRLVIVSCVIGAPARIGAIRPCLITAVIDIPANTGPRKSTNIIIQLMPPTAGCQYA
jgi:hypothetical protein